MAKRLAPRDKRTIPAFTYDGKEVFFDTASIGLVSREATEASRRIGVDWRKAVTQTQHACARLLGVDSPHINVFHNTTAGVQRILLRLQHLLGDYDASILTTDAEYPGCVATMDEQWRGPIIMARIAHYVYEGRGDLAHQAFRSAFLVARPRIVYLSHVARASGFVISESLLTFMRAMNPRVVIIVDGSQAVGNVVVGRSLLDHSDFYLWSGHKWLCGRTTLGLVYAKGDWSLEDPGQSHTLKTGSGGTGNLSALLSLSKSLEDFASSGGRDTSARMRRIASHNSALAKEFSFRCRSLGLLSLGAIHEDRGSATESWQWSGIVSILNPPLKLIEYFHGDSIDSSKAVTTRITAEDWRQSVGGTIAGAARMILDCDAKTGRVKLDEADFRELPVQLPPGDIIRCCFHYYHNLDDVGFIVNECAKGVGRRVLSCE